MNLSDVTTGLSLTENEIVKNESECVPPSPSLTSAECGTASWSDEEDEEILNLAYEVYTLCTEILDDVVQAVSCGVYNMCTGVLPRPTPVLPDANRNVGDVKREVPWFYNMKQGLTNSFAYWEHSPDMKCDKIEAYRAKNQPKNENNSKQRGEKRKCEGFKKEKCFKRRKKEGKSDQDLDMEVDENDVTVSTIIYPFGKNNKEKHKEGQNKVKMKTIQRGKHKTKIKMLESDQNLQKITKFFSTRSSMEVCQLGGHGPKPGVEKNSSGGRDSYSTLVKGMGGGD